MDEVTPVYDCDAHKLLIGDVLRQCSGEYTCGELSLENSDMTFELDKSEEVWVLKIANKDSGTSQTIDIIPTCFGPTGPRRYALCPVCQEQKLTIWLHPDIDEFRCKICSHIKQKSKSEAHLKRRIERFICKAKYREARRR